jgi:MerR family transcriptional regulator, light-induced transcriptional regulator
MKKTAASQHDSLPIRTVSGMTGLSPDLIRAWEKRHGVVRPVRGARGARLYSMRDVVHLRLLARVVDSGRAIGDVAHLDVPSLEKLLAGTVSRDLATTDAAPETRGWLQEVVQGIRRFDRAGVARLLGDALVGLGSRAFVHQAAAPLLREVGDGWKRGELSIADERLSTVALRNLLAGLVQSRPRRGGPVIVLASPAGERHELGLVLTGLLALDAGLDVWHLGADLPAAEIVAAARRSNATIVGLSVVSGENRARAVREVKAIQDGLPATTELWLGGGDARAVAARVEPFGGLLLDELERAEIELDRVADAASIGRVAQ